MASGNSTRPVPLQHVRGGGWQALLVERNIVAEARSHQSYFVSITVTPSQFGPGGSAIIAAQRAV